MRDHKLDRGEGTGLGRLDLRDGIIYHKHLHAAYVGLKNSLQHEWGFIQYATQILSYNFRPVDKDLREKFLPSLLLGAETTMPDQATTGFPIKNTVLAINDPILNAQGNWTAS